MNMMNNMDKTVFQSKYHFFDTCIRSAFLNGYCSQDYFMSRRIELASILQSIYNVESVNDLPFDLKDSLVSTITTNPFDGKSYYILWVMEDGISKLFKLVNLNMNIYIVTMPKYFKEFIKGNTSISFDRDKSIELANTLANIYRSLFGIFTSSSAYGTIYTMFNLYQYHASPCFEKGANVDDAVSFMDNYTFINLMENIGNDYKKMINRVGKFSIDPYTVDTSSYRVIYDGLSKERRD